MPAIPRKRFRACLKIREAFAQYMSTVRGRQNSKQRLWTEQANELAAEYRETIGGQMTLRQLFYAMVGKEHLENTQKHYDSFGSCLSDARMLGTFDWDIIEDRTREVVGSYADTGVGPLDLRSTEHLPRHPEIAKLPPLARFNQPTNPDPEHHSCMLISPFSYRRPMLYKESTDEIELGFDAEAYITEPEICSGERFDTHEIGRSDGQQTHTYVALEKEALGGLFAPVCHELGVPLVVLRGHASDTLVRELAEYLHDHSLSRGARVVLLFFGDFDPRGIEIPEVTERKLRQFTEEIFLHGDGTARGFNVERLNTNSGWLTTERIALTDKQARERDLPPQVAKERDNISSDFEKTWGSRDCWELDALPPLELRQMLRDSIERHYDPARLKQRKKRVHWYNNAMMRRFWRFNREIESQNRRVDRRWKAARAGFVQIEEHWRANVDTHWIDPMPAGLRGTRIRGWTDAEETALLDMLRGMKRKTLIDSGEVLTALLRRRAGKAIEPVIVAAKKAQHELA